MLDAILYDKVVVVIVVPFGVVEEGQFKVELPATK